MSPDAYERILCDLARTGVFHAPQYDLSGLLSAAKACGFSIHRIDLADARDKSSLLTQLAAALAFPDWFGHNWDALSDCLNDLSWMPAEGRLILLEHCDNLQASRGEDFAILLQVLADAAVAWRAESVPFWVLVDLHAENVRGLPELA